MKKKIMSIFMSVVLATSYLSMFSLASKESKKETKNETKKEVVNNDIFVAERDEVMVLDKIGIVTMPNIYENTETEEIEVEPETITETIVEELSYIEPETTSEIVTEEIPYLTDYEIDLVALVVMAEAEGEPEEGQRLVIDVILNRMDDPYFPNTIEGVLYQQDQFECLWNDRINVCYVRDDIRQLVVEEMSSRVSYNAVFFRTKQYFNFGTPLFQVGHHYFSSL